MTSLTDVLPKLTALLDPLTKEERRRVMLAVFALLGDEVPVLASKVERGAEGALDNSTAALSTPARAFIARNGLTVETLQSFFEVEAGSAQVIDLPAKAGATNKEKVLSTYLACGFASFLVTGETTFTDSQARELCIHFGCYDSNHTKYLKSFGNKLTGTKSTGWKITAPGLAAVAALLK